jgi:hypothetical protein
VKPPQPTTVKVKGSGRCATPLSSSDKEEGRVSPSTADFDGMAAETLFKARWGKLGLRPARGVARAGRRRSGLSPELGLVAVMADGEKIFPYARSVGTEARVNGLCRLLDGEAPLVLECARHTELERRR